jgi:hypothetical protein
MCQVYRTRDLANNSQTCQPTMVLAHFVYFWVWESDLWRKVQSLITVYNHVVMALPIFVPVTTFICHSMSGLAKDLFTAFEPCSQFRLTCSSGKFLLILQCPLHITPVQASSILVQSLVKFFIITAVNKATLYQKFSVTHT